jgi:hypothetical protein
MPARSSFLAACLGLGLLSGSAILAQVPAPKAKAYTPPRTADGQPDLQGVWNNATVTPLERPAEFAGKVFFTPAEAAAYEKQMVAHNDVDRRPASGESDVAPGYNNAWWDRGTHVVKTLRTSLIVDPPDGKLPSFTPDGERRAVALAVERRDHGADGPENRSLGERCLLWGTAGPPMMPGPYNDNYQILQAPGEVIILVEMIHDVRVIPLDNRPHIPSGVRQWMGDPRGRWEGNTLVVDSTNFTGKTGFRGASENLHLVERFTRTAPDTILYEFTVDDPATFTKPWTAAITMNQTQGPIYEYACHEGNYGMSGILSGARADERKR